MMAGACLIFRKPAQIDRYTERFRPTVVTFAQAPPANIVNAVYYPSWAASRNRAAVTSGSATHAGNWYAVRLWWLKWNHEGLPRIMSADATEARYDGKIVFL